MWWKRKWKSELCSTGQTRNILFFSPFSHINRSGIITRFNRCLSFFAAKICNAGKYGNTTRWLKDEHKTPWISMNFVRNRFKVSVSRINYKIWNRFFFFKWGLRNRRYVRKGGNCISERENSFHGSREILVRKKKIEKKNQRKKGRENTKSGKQDEKKSIFM